MRSDASRCDCDCDCGCDGDEHLQLRLQRTPRDAIQCCARSHLTACLAALASALARSSPAIAALPSSQILFTRLDLAPATQQLLLSLAVRSSSSSAATALLSALASSSVLEVSRQSMSSSHEVFGLRCDVVCYVVFVGAAGLSGSFCCHRSDRSARLTPQSRNQKPYIPNPIFGILNPEPSRFSLDMPGACSRNRGP